LVGQDQHQTLFFKTVMSERQVIVKTKRDDGDRPMTMSERFATINKEHKQKNSRDETRSPGVQKQEKTGRERERKGRGKRFACKASKLIGIVSVQI
jgi:hypothetical protein